MKQRFIHVNLIQPIARCDFRIKYHGSLSKPLTGKEFRYLMFFLKFGFHARMEELAIYFNEPTNFHRNRISQIIANLRKKISACKLDIEYDRDDQIYYLVDTEYFESDKKVYERAGVDCYHRNIPFDSEMRRTLGEE